MLDRIPELGVLASHPSISRALRSGNPHRVYRALWWGSLLGRFSEHKELVKNLLVNRRLFLSPISGAPGMYTLNGVGTRVYGESDRDVEDGTYIGTLFFTVVFAPLYPIRQYLCRSDGSEYQFFAKVPFDSLTYLWRQLVVLVGALGILGAGFASWERMRHNDLTIANGLDFAVHVQIGDTDLEVPPNEIVTERFGIGDYRVVATDPDGNLLEEETLNIPSSADVVAWNVAGASFLVEIEVPYSVGGEVEQRDPNVFCGQKYIVRNSVEFAFEEVPEEISLSSSTSVAFRTHFDHYPGGWRLCAQHMVHSGKPDEGITLASRFADLDSPYDLRTIHSLIVAARGNAAGDVWIEEALTTRDGVELHRLRQDSAIMEGRYEEIRAIYREYQGAHPDSPEAVYLRARAESYEVALPLIENARKQWSENRYLLRSHAWNLHHSGRFAEALPLWVQLNSGPDAVWYDYQAEALIALDQTLEAHQVLQTARPTNLNEAAFRHMTALAAGRQPASFDSYGLGYDPDFTNAFINARANQRVYPSTLNAIKDLAARAAVEVIVEMHNDGPSAMQHYAEAPEDIDTWLDLGTHILLLGEAHHAGNEVLVARIQQVLDFQSFGAAAVRIADLSSTEDDFEYLPLGLRACAELAASRHPDVSARAAERLRAAAGRDEVLESVITHALDSWAS